VRRRVSWASSTPVVGAGFAQHVRDVHAHGLLADDHYARDLRVGAASHDVRKDLALARSEAGEDGAVLGTLHGCHGGQRHPRAGCGPPPRWFRSFSDAAQEAAISRLCGGIHFRPAIELGLAQGHQIGQAARRLAPPKYV